MKEECAIHVEAAGKEVDLGRQELFVMRAAAVFFMCKHKVQRMSRPNYPDIFMSMSENGFSVAN